MGVKCSEKSISFRLLIMEKRMEGKNHPEEIGNFPFDINELTNFLLLFGY